MKVLPRKTHARIAALWLALSLVTNFCLRVPYWDIPLSRDEGSYLTSAWMRLHGGRYYTDFIDFKPPGSVPLLAAGLKGFGETDRGIRIFMALWMALSLALIWAVARRLLRSIRSATIASLAAGAWTAHPHLFGFSIMLEPLLLLPIMTAAWLVLDDARRAALPARMEWFLAGLCLGYACWIKQSAVFWIPAVLIPALAYRPAAGKSRQMANLLWCACAMAAVSAAWIRFLDVAGDLGAFHFFAFKIADEYGRFIRWSLSLQTGLEQSWRMVRELPILALFPAAVLAVLLSP